MAILVNRRNYLGWKFQSGTKKWILRKKIQKDKKIIRACFLLTKLMIYYRPAVYKIKNCFIFVI